MYHKKSQHWLAPRYRFWCRLICFLVVSALQSISMADELSPEDFLIEYCLDCHDDATQKGKVNLEGFGKDSDLRSLFDVYDQTILGYMPPEKKAQPTVQQREAFLQHVESLLVAQGQNRKLQAGYGNYVNHQKLFTKNPVRGYTPTRLWRVDPSSMAEIANKLIGRTVYRPQRQGVTKENPAFSFTTPAHTFKDFAAANYFENTTTELLISYAKQIVDNMYKNRFSNQLSNEKKIQAGKWPAKKPKPVYDRIGETYRLLFNRDISPEERERLSVMDERAALVALVMKVESIYRREVTMNHDELAKAIGFALHENGPDKKLYDEIRTRPLAEILDERMQTDAFHARLVRFTREYFEYDNAPNVFKDPVDLFPALTKRQGTYKPDWYVRDAEYFCLNILENDQQVLKQLLTSNEYSVRGGMNSTHGKVLKRSGPNFYKLGYHGTYGLTRDQVGPWRQLHKVKYRMGILHHPAWLISFSDNEKNGAIQRGKWITSKLLGGAVPDTPVEVDAQLPIDPHKTLRERMSVTREKECWACHVHMDDQGLPFEQFDFLGQYRKQEIGRKLNTTGLVTLTDHQTGKKTQVHITDPYQYVRILSESRHVQQVFLRHVFRYFMGRNESLNDAGTLIAMDETYTKTKGSLKAAIKVLLLSDSFRVRKPQKVPAQLTSK